MRKNHVMLRLLLLTLLLYAMGTFTAARWELLRQQMQTRELEAKKQTLLAQRRELEERSAALEDADALRLLAWERLHMLRPDERVFAFTEPEVPSD